MQFVITTLVVYLIISCLLYQKLSKYLTYSRISKKIYIDVISGIRYRILNYKRHDGEIKEDFYQDAEKAILKLRPGRVYKIKTHAVVFRRIKNHPAIDIIDSKVMGKTNLNFVNLIIGKRTFNEKEHKSYHVKFKVKPQSVS